MGYTRKTLKRALTSSRGPLKFGHVWVWWMGFGGSGSWFSWNRPLRSVLIARLFVDWMDPTEVEQGYRSWSRHIQP